MHTIKQMKLALERAGMIHTRGVDYPSLDVSAGVQHLRDLIALTPEGEDPVEYVRRLPKTADGVAIIPHAIGHHVWWIDSYGNAYLNRNVVQGGDGVWYAFQGWLPDAPLSEGNFDPDFNNCRPLSECYSSREAAEAAKGA